MAITEFTKYMLTFINIFARPSQNGLGHAPPSPRQPPRTPISRLLAGLEDTSINQKMSVTAKGTVTAAKLYDEADTAHGKDEHRPSAGNGDFEGQVHTENNQKVCSNEGANNDKKFLGKTKPWRVADKKKDRLIFRRRIVPRQESGYFRHQDRYERRKARAFRVSVVLESWAIGRLRDEEQRDVDVG
ncbi:hypothetical protein GP486_003881 [Trichoglossum hirsutum]|uniref:Uncharacterized protein n=1 Tax=Trichoglossum hirsutum TaxID=265104 RepID=A0A9P8LCG0_9PEZI|nr:hypothetical protein GP486_003881 [Trichoglossum hirsutum]